MMGCGNKFPQSRHEMTVWHGEIECAMVRRQDVNVYNASEDMDPLPACLLNGIYQQRNGSSQRFLNWATHWELQTL